MTKNRFLAAMLSLLSTSCLLLAAGCDDAGDPPPDDDAGPGDDPEPAEPTIDGDWLVSEGSLIPGLGANLTSVGIRFGADDTGVAVLEDLTGAVRECLPVFATRLDDTVAVDFGASGVPVGALYRIASLEDDSLTLVDDEGRFLFLVRPDDQPGFDCDPLEPISIHEDLPPALTGYATDLEFDGTNLFYADPANTAVISVDVADGSLNTAVPLSPNAVLAAEGGDFWVSCNCGGNTDVTRRAANGNTVDTVDSATLGEGVNIQAAVIDPNNGHLLLFGLRDQKDRFLLDVNAAVEPDVLTSITELTAGPSLQSLASDGTHLWTIGGIIHGVLLRLNPTTGAVIQSIQLPRPDVHWSHVAINDGRMFLLGSSGPIGAPAGTLPTTIIEVVPPPLP